MTVIVTDGECNLDDIGMEQLLSNIVSREWDGYNDIF